MILWKSTEILHSVNRENTWMCFFKLVFGKRQHYPCKYPAWNCSFLKTLQTFSLKGILSVPHTCLLHGVRVQVCIPCFEIFFCAEMQRKTKMFWYSMNWSSYGWSYLMPCWRVCIINEVAGNLSVKGRRMTGEILIMLPPSLFQGISWGWHFVRLCCLWIIFQLDGECSETFHCCVLCMCLRGTC